jgi:CHASE1-domain containing sensor protein
VHDQEVAAKEFNLRSTNYVASFTREMEGLLASVESVATFAELDSAFDRQKFEMFAAQEVRIHPAIVALEWLPHITHAERPDYERLLSQSEGRNAMITSGIGIDPRPALEESDYFPITFMFPRTVAAKIIGFDGYSQKVLHSELDKSRDSGTPASPGKFHLVEQMPDGFAMPFYVPVYRGAGANRTVEERRR